MTELLAIVIAGSAVALSLPIQTQTPPLARARICLVGKQSPNGVCPCRQDSDKAADGGGGVSVAGQIWLARWLGGTTRCSSPSWRLSGMCCQLICTQATGAGRQRRPEIRARMRLLTWKAPSRHLSSSAAASAAQHAQRVQSGGLRRRAASSRSRKRPPWRVIKS